MPPKISGSSANNSSNDTSSSPIWIIKDNIKYEFLNKGTENLNGTYNVFVRLSPSRQRAMLVKAIVFAIFTLGIYQSGIKTAWEEFKSGERLIKGLEAGKVPEEAQKTIKIAMKAGIITPIVDPTPKPDDPIVIPEPVVDPTPNPVDPLKKPIEVKIPEAPKPMELTIQRGDLDHANILDWLQQASKNPILKQTDLYIILNEIISKIGDKNEIKLTNNDLLILKYSDLQDKILELKNTSKEELPKTTQRQTDEFVFNLLKTENSQISQQISTLESPENGTLKAKITALLPLTEQTATLEEFLNKANEGENSTAKEGFAAFTDLLKSEIPVSSPEFKQKLQQDNQAEATIQTAIKHLAIPLAELSKLASPVDETKLLKNLKEINQIFGTIVALNIDDAPFLKRLLIQHTPHTTMAYQLLNEAKGRIFQNVELHEQTVIAIGHMENLLEATERQKLDFVIKLGEQILLKPQQDFNQYQYLELTGGLKFTATATALASVEHVENFLSEINQILTENTCSAKDLLALEAFTSIALYTHIVNPIINRSLINELTSIRTKIRDQMNLDGTRYEIAILRKEEKNQAFYNLLKEKMEDTPNYPRNFWIDPKIAKKMKDMDDSSLTEIIRRKIGNSQYSPPEESNLLVFQNSSPGLRYEIYFHSAQSESEKPKLLLFVTEETKCSQNPLAAQCMDHQLGLFGDSAILPAAREILSNITSTNILEGYSEDLKAGKLEIIAAGFDGGGSSATLIANRMAILYPKTQVTSIAAGSTTTVSTEEAYSMSQATNFLPIRLRYEKDTLVDRSGGNYIGDFSKDVYNTFPLSVSLNENFFDFKGHNKTEYGNVTNFNPAMRNPVVLREVYQETCDGIDVISSSDNQKIIKRTTDLISLGDYILKEKVVATYDKKFLKFDRTTIEGPIDIVPTSGEEEVETIYSLQQIIADLNSPRINTLNPNQIFSLIIATNTLIINYTEINRNIGKTQQIVDLLSKIRNLSNSRLEELKLTNGKIVQGLVGKYDTHLVHLAVRATKLNGNFNETLFDSKHKRGSRDVLGKISYEDQFLEFLGFKTAVKDIDKIGSDSYVSKLCNDSENKYDISLFTPEDRNKKQRIVICCKGGDDISIFVGSPTSILGQGDPLIIDRAEKLEKIILNQLKKLIGNPIPNDVDIVLTGHGSEGAVATALGYFLSKKYANNQIQSIGFGAPSFITKEHSRELREQPNFISLRFLNSQDNRFELGRFPGTSFKDAYHTISFEGFRRPGASQLGGHQSDLYGDAHLVKASMKNAYLLRSIVQQIERERLQQAEAKSPSFFNKVKSPAKVSSPKAAAAAQPIFTPIRIVIDNRKTDLTLLSAKPIENLKEVAPGKLIQIMKYCVELAESDTISHNDQALVKTFFANFIQAIHNKDINESHPIRNPFLEKMIAHGYHPNQLFGGKWKLQKMISEELKKAMQEVAKMNPEIPQKNKDELILTRNYWRGILAGDLNGNRYKPAGGGVNGAVFFRHLESGLNKPEALLPYEEAHISFLGVFKPHPDTVRDFKGKLDLTQWGERVKDTVGMAANLNKDDMNQRVHNEVFAYEMFHIFGFDQHNIGFPTTLEFTNKNDDPRPASFCAFLPGLDLVGSHVEKVSLSKSKTNVLDDKRKNYFPDELNIWQMSKIFDFLTGNMDGHEGNAFVKVDKGMLVGAVNFDYDKAFPIRKTPSIGNQYKWGNLEISKRDFTPATKQALTEMFKEPEQEQKLQAFLNMARGKGQIPNNFTPEQENFLRDRIAILKQVADGTIKTPADLAKSKA